MQIRKANVLSISMLNMRCMFCQMPFSEHDVDEKVMRASSHGALTEDEVTQLKFDAGDSGIFMYFSFIFGFISSCIFLLFLVPHRL